MIELEIDGKKVQVPEGSMVMHAGDKVGTYIPHFCYHKKLSIAANCRMCLVDIEKAPKPMPACATPATQGMIVRTRSDKAMQAQKGVMEFLLINHPLDCPICDQGGECQLQDLAVGYGASASRYTEEKRVVFRKDAGPLVGLEEMTRCIHCTRCIRFGIEIGGVMELGMVHRGEHAEITTIAGDTIDSELSGNMIDLCPVGALTSKPFRFSARTWELSRRKSISPHDSTGANLIVQVKGDRVMRVLPFENEEVNECWISDRDRFSYEALNVDDRLAQPMIKQGGEWKTVDWTTALEYVAHGLRDIVQTHGAASIGALAAPSSTVEELHLLARVMRGLGSENIDHRLRHADFGNRAAPVDGAPAARWLGTSIASLSTLDRVLVVGSFLRKDHPLFAQRIRQAARHGAQVHAIHALDDDWAMTMAERLVVAPSAWPRALAEVAAAVGAATGAQPPVAGVSAGASAQAIAASLLSGERKAILLGNAAAQHPQASTLLVLAQWLGSQTGASVGYLGEAVNSVGAQLVNALPGPDGLDAGQMLAQPRRAYVLLNTEAVLDTANPARTAKALGAADMVVALTPFRSSMDEHADVLLPIAPFTETSGTYINAEGRAQSFRGVVKAKGEARPAWKVLRVLGNVLGLDGFSFETSEDVRAQALGERAEVLPSRLSNATDASPELPGVARQLERVANVGIYDSDMLVRRATALRHTTDARPPVAALPAELWRRLGLKPGERVRVQQGGGIAELPAELDATLAPDTVRVPAGHRDTAALGALFGPIEIGKA